MKRLILMTVLMGTALHAAAPAVSGEDDYESLLNRFTPSEVSYVNPIKPASHSVTTATIPVALPAPKASAPVAKTITLFPTPAPTEPKTYWDTLKNAASYLNFYQMYKNYRDSEKSALLHKYELRSDELDNILLNHPEFFTYSGHAQDSIVAFAKREQELMSKNFELDDVLRSTIEPIFQRISADIKDLSNKTRSANVSDLQTLRSQIKNLEDQQIKLLSIMQEAQERIIAIKHNVIDQLSRPLANLLSSRETQTMITGAPQPSRSISPYRPQQQQDRYSTPLRPSAQPTRHVQFN